MRVWGKCEGSDIILSQEAGRWVTTVPAGKGEYVIELWAEDDAGNAGYMATMLLTYDPTQLCATFRLLDVGAGWTMDAVKAVMGGAPVVSARIESVGLAPSMQEVTVAVKCCEICGR